MHILWWHLLCTWITLLWHDLTNHFGQTYRSSDNSCSPKKDQDVHILTIQASKQHLQYTILGTYTLFYTHYKRIWSSLKKPSSKHQFPLIAILDILSNICPSLWFSYLSLSVCGGFRAELLFGLYIEWPWHCTLLALKKNRVGNLITIHSLENAATLVAYIISSFLLWWHSSTSDDKP